MMAGDRGGGRFVAGRPSEIGSSRTWRPYLYVHTHIRRHAQRNRYGPQKGEQSVPRTPRVSHHSLRVCHQHTRAGPPIGGVAPNSWFRPPGGRSIPAATAGTGRSSLALAGPAGIEVLLSGASRTRAGTKVAYRRWPPARRETSRALLIRRTLRGTVQRRLAGRGTRGTPSFGLRTGTPDVSNF